MPPARRRYTAQRAGWELHSAAGGIAPGSNHSRPGCGLLARDGASSGREQALVHVSPCVCVCVCARVRRVLVAILRETLTQSWRSALFTPCVADRFSPFRKLQQGGCAAGEIATF